jgi:hypothetical protein
MNTEHECITREELQNIKNDPNEEEKKRKLTGAVSRAGSCPICKRALLIVFGK